jgi:uncharacterized membrane protein
MRREGQMVQEPPSSLTKTQAAFHRVLTSMRLRTYNLGLYTSVVLFLPWGTFLALYFSGIVRASLLFNAIGLLLAVAEHAAIALYAISRRRKLGPAPDKGRPVGPLTPRTGAASRPHGPRKRRRSNRHG